MADFPYCHHPPHPQPNQSTCSTQESRVMQQSSDPDPTRPPQSRALQALPGNAITAILQHCSDFDSILNLAKTSDAIRMAIYLQQWPCSRCNTQIFADADLTTSTHAAPFMCSVCHEKLCGESVDYEKRWCRPQKCNGCGKLECHQCLEARVGNADGSGSENMCQKCQLSMEEGC